MHQYDSYFDELRQDPDTLALIGELVHGEPVSMGVETFNKPARTGSAVPPHQDNAYFCQSPPDMLTLWIALDPATVENGAVYYTPGSQHELLPHTPSGVTGNSIGLAQPPELGSVEEFCATLEPGDALIHHCQIIHRSEANTTEQSRCGLLMVYRGAHTETDMSLKEDYEKARAMVAPT
jgi:ectoine hydroxylase-related dioxygenase (phytanoyl-CoA dioxygenase family)